MISNLSSQPAAKKYRKMNEKEKGIEFLGLWMQNKMDFPNLKTNKQNKNKIK